MSRIRAQWNKITEKKFVGGREVIYVTAVAFTGKSRRLAQRAEEICRSISLERRQEIIWKNVTNMEEETFQTSDVILFFCASGIAVRKIAPFLQDKTTDPAVLVIGEDGNYVISLLSGHLGGANDWAKKIAEGLGGQPVITTATDSRGMPALDIWAEKNGLSIDDMKALKGVTAYLLERQEGASLDRKNAAEEGRFCRIVITEDSYPRELKKTENVLILRPKSYVLGIGCRRGTDFQKMEGFVSDFLREHDIDPRLIRRICSVERKKDEICIKRTARRLKAPFTVFSPEELEAVLGEFSSSSFVAKTVGVDNVCERSAVLGSSYEGMLPGQLFVKKTVSDGMTIAAARIPSDMGESLILTPEQWMRLAQEKRTEIVKASE